MGSQSESRTFPGSKVGSHVDRAAGALLLADGPVLVKGTSTLDRGLLNAGGPVDVVGGTAIDNASHAGGSRGWVVSAKVLNHVVLDKRVSGPSIDGQVRVAVGLIGARVIDGAVAYDPCQLLAPAHDDMLQHSPSSTRVPSLTTNPVAVAGPRHRVLAASLVGIPHVRAAVGPEGEVVPIVCTGSAGCVGLTFGQPRKLTRGSEDTSGHCRGGNEKGRKGDHLDVSGRQLESYRPGRTRGLGSISSVGRQRCLYRFPHPNPFIAARWYWVFGGSGFCPLSLAQAFNPSPLRDNGGPCVT